jgi:hypothetical protein
MIVDCQQNSGFTDILGIVLAAATTMAAAFFGAKYAFRLQNEKERREIVSANVTSADYATFQLHRTINHFTAYRKQFLDQWRNDARRHFIIRPSLGDAIAPQTYDFQSLAFLFNSKDPNILSSLAILEDETKTIAAAIKERTDVHVSQFQPLAEVMPMESEYLPSLAELTRECGPRLSQTLKMSTDQIIVGVDHILEIARDLADRIKRQTEAVYPGQNVLGTAHGDEA